MKTYKRSEKVVQIPNVWGGEQEILSAWYQKQVSGLNGLTKSSKFFFELSNLVS